MIGLALTLLFATVFQAGFLFVSNQILMKNNKEKDNEQTASIHKTIQGLTDKVVTALTRRIADGDMIHIEDIQDQVELAIMRAGYQDVARAYVIYREDRAKARKLGVEQTDDMPISKNMILDDGS